LYPGWLKICKKKGLEFRLPYAKEMEPQNMYADLPAETDPKYQFLLELKIWYFDDWIPKLAGNDWYGSDQIKLYHHPCEPVVIFGKKQPRVSKASIVSLFWS